MTKRIKNKLALLEKIVSIHENVHRDILIKYTGWARSTIFDGLKVLVNQGVLVNLKAQLGLELGRPLSVWSNNTDLSKQPMIWDVKMTKQQREALDVSKHTLYLHLWGRGTGKTLTALRMGYNTKEPTLYIVPDKKEKTFLYYHHMVKFRTIAENSGWNIEKKIFKVAYHGNYMQTLIKMMKERPKEKMLVIVDGYSPRGDIVVKNLLNIKNIKVVLFATPSKEATVARTKESLTYLNKLYYGFSKLPYKTSSMKTMYYPTASHLKELKKVYGGNYQIPPQCMTEDIYKALEQNVSHLHFMAEYDCMIARVLENMLEE